MMKKVLRAFWPSVKKHWVLAFITAISMIASVCISAIPQHYVREIVNIYTSPQPETTRAKTLFWAMVWCFVAMQIAYRIFNFTTAYFEARVIKDLDKRSMATIQRQSMRFFENSFSGALVKSTSRFKSAFESITDLVMFEVGRDIIIFAVVITIFAQNLPSFAIAFAIWTAVFLLFSVGAAYLKFSIDLKDAEADSLVSATLADSMSCHHTVKVYGAEGAEQQRFDNAVNKNYRTRMLSWNASNIIIAIQGALIAVAELGLIWWMMGEWEHGRITAGDFVFFQMYVLWILDHLWSFGNSFRQIMHHFAQAKEMSDIFALVPEVQNAPGARPITIRNGGITFDHVCFKYPEEKSGSFELKDITLQIPSGQTVGLVGKTGSGKSTLVRLLMRLSDTDSGSILIDDQDICSATQVSLRQQIAVVSQPPQLFHRTIRENIAFGNANASEADIIDAATSAHAWEFIEKLPSGLDTIVGERGVKLSGGQLQRIAIARAILADAKIIIFDEATSALDSETEACIQDAMKRLFKGRTCIVIAHRLSTIAKLNRILVIEDGVIVEDDTHAKLRNIPGGQYARLWNRQTEQFINE